jgi:hypothetical protein
MSAAAVSSSSWDSAPLLEKGSTFGRNIEAGGHRSVCRGNSDLAETGRLAPAAKAVHSTRRGLVWNRSRQNTAKSSHSFRVSPLERGGCSAMLHADAADARARSAALGHGSRRSMTMKQPRAAPGAGVDSRSAGAARARAVTPAGARGSRRSTRRCHGQPTWTGRRKPDGPSPDQRGARPFRNSVFGEAVRGRGPSFIGQVNPLSAKRSG